MCRRWFSRAARIARSFLCQVGEARRSLHHGFRQGVQLVEGRQLLKGRQEPYKAEKK